MPRLRLFKKISKRIRISVRAARATTTNQPTNRAAIGPARTILAQKWQKNGQKCIFLGKMAVFWTKIQFIGEQSRKVFVASSLWDE